MFKSSNSKILKCSNVHMFKYSNIQIFKYSNDQILKCSNNQIFKCSNVHIFKFSNVQMFKWSNDQMIKWSNVQMFKCQMSNIKCQSLIRLNFCRSVLPEFLRSFLLYTPGGALHLDYLIWIYCKLSQSMSWWKRDKHVEIKTFWDVGTLCHMIIVAFVQQILLMGAVYSWVWIYKELLAGLIKHFKITFVAVFLLLEGYELFD